MDAFAPRHRGGRSPDGIREGRGTAKPRRGSGTTWGSPLSLSFLLLPFAGRRLCAAGSSPTPSPSKTFSYPRMAPDPAKRCVGTPRTAARSSCPAPTGWSSPAPRPGSGAARSGPAAPEQCRPVRLGAVRRLVRGGRAARARHRHALRRAERLRPDNSAATPTPVGGPRRRRRGRRGLPPRRRCHEGRGDGCVHGRGHGLVAGGRFPDQVDAVVALSLFRTTWNASGPPSPTCTRPPTPCRGPGRRSSSSGAVRTSRGPCRPTPPSSCWPGRRPPPGARSWTARTAWRTAGTCSTRGLAERRARRCSRSSPPTCVVSPAGEPGGAG